MANQLSTRRSARIAQQKPAGLDVWQRMTRLLAVLAVCGVGGLAFVYFIPEKEKLDELQTSNELLEQRRDQLLAMKSEHLRIEQESLHDKAYLEMLARDRLNMQLPGETVIRIENDGFSPARRP